MAATSDPASSATSADAALTAAARRAAERLLVPDFGRGIRIATTDLLAGAPGRTILRATLKTGEPEPATVLLALTADLAPWVEEAAACEFVASLDLDRPVSRAFYGADEKERLLVLEDVDWPDATAALAGEDAVTAEASLEAAMRALGRLDAASAERTDEYEYSLRALDPARRPVAEWQTRVRREIEKFADTFAELEFDWTPALVDDVQQAAAGLLNPGPFLALSPGVISPSGFLVAADKSRPPAVIASLAGSALRHAVVDAMAARMSFPTADTAGVVPSPILGRLESAYRLELGLRVPIAKDEATFSDAAVEACAFHMLETTNRLMPRALRFEERWGTATYRQRIVRVLAAFSEASLHAGYLPALGSFASIMRERLAAKWPELREMVVFPAFAGLVPH